MPKDFVAILMVMQVVNDFSLIDSVVQIVGVDSDAQWICVCEFLLDLANVQSSIERFLAIESVIADSSNDKVNAFDT